MSENLEALLFELQKQESEIQFSRFDNETALQVGMSIYETAKAKGKSVTIDITRNGQQLFHLAMDGTSRDNADWVRRKTNVVNRFGHSSYLMGIRMKISGSTLEQKFGVSPIDYAAHGGSFPLLIQNVGLVGTVTVSGLPQQEDHDLVVTTLQKFL